MSLTNTTTYTQPWPMGYLHQFLAHQLLSKNNLKIILLRLVGFGVFHSYPKIFILSQILHLRKILHNYLRSFVALPHQTFYRKHLKSHHNSLFLVQIIASFIQITSILKLNLFIQTFHLFKPLKLTLSSPSPTQTIDLVICFNPKKAEVHQMIAVIRNRLGESRITAR